MDILQNQLKIAKMPLYGHCYLEYVYGLLLDGEDGEHVAVQVEALVVREEDLVAVEQSAVAQPACLELHQVQRVVLERRVRVRRHRLVVAVDVEEERMRLRRDVRSRPDDHVACVVREERALAVQMLRVDGDVRHVFEPEERGEERTPQRGGPVAFETRLVAAVIAQQRAGGGRTAELVDLQRRLVGGERDEVPAVGRELTQEARRLLDVDDAQVREDVGVEGARHVRLGARTRAVRLAPRQALHQVLRRDAA